MPHLSDPFSFDSSDVPSSYQQAIFVKQDPPINYSDEWPSVPSSTRQLLPYNANSNTSTVHGDIYDESERDPYAPIDPFRNCTGHPYTTAKPLSIDSMISNASAKNGNTFNQAPTNINDIYSRTSLEPLALQSGIDAASLRKGNIGATKLAAAVNIGGESGRKVSTTYVMWFLLWLLLLNFVLFCDKITVYPS